jgi:adenine C2-methylase RlmN of 23S rRNA A2503 and tRNA A37
MPRSQYLELLDEETGLTRGAKGIFGSVGGLADALKKRAAFVAKVESAFATGELTEKQKDELIALNRQHSLPLAR